MILQQDIGIWNSLRLYIELFRQALSSSSHYWTSDLESTLFTAVSLTMGGQTSDRLGLIKEQYLHALPRDSTTFSPKRLITYSTIGIESLLSAKRN